MVFDDYEWGSDLPETHRPKMAVDAFLSIFEEKIYLIYQGYQVAVQRR